MANKYKDEHGHWTSKENDGGPCKHDGAGIKKSYYTNKNGDKSEFYVNKEGKLTNGALKFDSEKDLNDYMSKYGFSKESDSDAFDDDFDEEFDALDKPKSYQDELDDAEAHRFDSLSNYLDWEGIYGYTDNILEEASLGKDNLREYLENEGIYGYEDTIYELAEEELEKRGMHVVDINDNEEDEDDAYDKNTLKDFNNFIKSNNIKSPSEMIEKVQDLPEKTRNDYINMWNDDKVWLDLTFDEDENEKPGLKMGQSEREKELDRAAMSALADEDDEIANKSQPLEIHNQNVNSHFNKGDSAKVEKSIEYGDLDEMIDNEVSLEGLSRNEAIKKLKQNGFQIKGNNVYIPKDTNMTYLGNNSFKIGDMELEFYMDKEMPLSLSKSEQDKMMPGGAVEKDNGYNYLDRDIERLKKDPWIPIKEHWSDAYYNEVMEEAKEKKKQQANLDAKNPKYKDFSRSDLTNIEHLDTQDVYDRDTGTRFKESLLKYIPYGSLQDGNRDYLYGVVRDYDGKDTWRGGAEVTASEKSGRDALNTSRKYHNSGTERWLGRGKYDKEFFDIIRDKNMSDDEDRAKYSKKYGWNFDKNFEDQGFDDEWMDSMIDSGDLSGLDDEFVEAINKRKASKSQNKTPTEHIVSKSILKQMGYSDDDLAKLTKDDLDIASKFFKRFEINKQYKKGK